MATTPQGTRHEIKARLSGSTFVIDESVDEAEIRRRCGRFFRTPHGKRETYEAYRGFLIVRSTNQFGNAPPARRTVMYLFAVEASEGNNAGETYCISSDYRDARDARRHADRIIAAGEYTYGKPRE